MLFTVANWETLGWYSDISEDQIEIRDFTVDSRSIRKNYAFIAIDGVHFKGKDFAFNALDKGASAVFLDSRYRLEIYDNPRFEAGMPFFFSEDFINAAGQTISYYMGEPSRHLHCIGITGTNGKTTIGTAFHEVLNGLRHKTGYIGTLGIYLKNEKQSSALTTPGLYDIHKTLAKALKKKVNYISVEASSHGLHQGRLAGINWNLAVFTNLTPDHLDYHGSMQNYYEAKQILFLDMLELSKRAPRSVHGAVIILADQYAQKLYKWLKDSEPSFPVIGIGEGADAEIVGIQPSWSGYHASILFGRKTYRMKTSFLGEFNLQNLSAVFIGSLLMGMKPYAVLLQIAALKPPAGRMQVIEGPGGRKIIIDYAHTPDALENLLKTVHELNPIRVITVFGCGGDRDQEKRPLMGKTASMYSDFIVLTNDNPRSEDPQTIISHIKEGIEITHYVVVTERDKAIRVGLQILGPREVLVIAGKGHEDYQIINDRKLKFSDIEISEKFLREMEYEQA